MSSLTPGPSLTPIRQRERPDELRRWSALDDAGVEARKAALEARWIRLSHWIYPLLFGSMASAFTALLSSGKTMQGLGLPSLALLLSCIGALGFVCERIDDIKIELAELLPLSPERKDQARKLARACPLARAWMEAAESQGRSPRWFDLAEMERLSAPALKKRAEAKARRAERARAHERAPSEPLP